MATTPNLQRLVVLLDGATSTAEQLLPWAKLVAAERRIPLTLLHVVDPARVSEPVQVAKVIAHDYLELVASRLRTAADAPQTTLEVRQGLVQEEWQDYSEKNPGCMLLVSDVYDPGGTRTLRFSPLDGLLGSCSTPLFVVPARATLPAKIERVVVGTGGDELAEDIYEYVRDEAAPGVEIIEVEAVERGTVPDHQLLELKPVLTDARVSLRGKAGPLILATARVRKAQLIVVGAHRKGAIRTMLVGSTSQWLARNSDRPVLIVPEGWLSEA